MGGLIETAMDDHEKSRDQLLDELADLRRRLGESASEARAPTGTEDPLDCLPVMVACISADGRCERINRAMADSLGMNADDAIGMPWTDVMGHKGYHGFPAYVQRALTGESVHFQYRRHLDDGEILHRDCHLLPRRNQAGAEAGFFIVINDITELRRIEEELRLTQHRLEKRVAERTAELKAEVHQHEKTERSLRRASMQAREFLAMIERSPMVAIRWRMVDRCPVEFVSDNVRQFGYTPEQLLSGDIHWPALMHPDDREPTMAEVEDYIKRGVRSFEQRYRLITADAQVRWIQDYTIALADDSGKVTHLEAVLLDVTERFEAEEALRSSERRFRRMVDASPLAMCITRHADGEMLYANAAFEKMLGEAPGGWRGRLSLRYYDNEPDRTAFLQTLERDGRVRGFEQALRRVDNKELAWVVTNLEPIRYLDQDALLCGFHDITGRKRMEQQLREREHQYRSLVQTAGSVIICLDAERRIWEWNDEAERILGYTRDEAIGKDAYELLLADPVRQNFLARRSSILAGEPFHNVEIPLRARDGTTRVMLWNSTRVLDAEGNLAGTISIGQDITERKRIAQALADREQHYRSLVQTAGSVIIVYAPDGTVLDWNAEAERVLGWRREEIIGKDPIDLLLPQAQRESARKRRLEVQQGAPVRGLERTVLTRTGESRVLLWNATLITGPDGELTAMVSIGQDITDLKQTQQALADSEERLRAIVGALPDVSFVFDEDGRYLEVLGAEPESLDAPESELRGRRLHDLMPPAEADRYLALIRRTIETGRPQSLEYEMTVAAGDRWFEGRTSPMDLVRDGKRTAVWLARDITDRRRAEAALRESEERYRLHFENASDVICALDLNGVITMVSPSVEGIVGYKVDELRGRRLVELDLMTPQAAARAAEEIPRVLGGETIYSEYDLRNSDGRTVVAETNAAPLLKDGQVIGLVVVARDVTARRQAERDLRRSEQRMRALLSALPDLIFSYDAEGRFLDFVSTQGDPPAMPPEQFLGRKVNEILPPELSDATVHSIRRALDGEMPIYEYPLHVPFPDGPVRHYEARYVAIGEDEVMAITRNITDRKQSEAQLMDYQQQLRSLASELSLTEERERRRIAAELHDRIGQALALCRLRLRTVRDTVDSPDAERAVADVRGLIEQTIRDTRSLTFELSPPVLYELGFEPGVEWLAEHLGEEHGLKIRVQDDGEPKPLDEDVRTVLFTAVRELLINSAKHAAASEAVVRMSRGGDRIRIEVSDDGVGFDPAQAASARAESPGHPFGLFSIRERLGPLGGTLMIDSAPGRGTRATVVAPLADAADAANTSSGEE